MGIEDEFASSQADVPQDVVVEIAQQAQLPAQNDPRGPPMEVAQPSPQRAERDGALLRDIPGTGSVDCGHVATPFLLEGDQVVGASPLGADFDDRA